MRDELCWVAADVAGVLACVVGLVFLPLVLALSWLMRDPK